MKTRITSTSVAQPLGPERTRRLLTFGTGVLSGRKVAVFLSAAGTIGFAWADRPHEDWSAVVTLASNVAGSGFSAAIDDTGNLLLAYVDAGANELMAVGVVWDGTAWQVAAPVTVFSGDVNSDPALVIDSSGVTWIAWSRLAGGVRRIHVKSSADLGTTWGSGSADAGEQIHAGGLVAVASLAVAPGCLYVSYYYDSQLLCVRRRLLPDGDWSSPAVAASGLETSPTFTSAVRDDGLLGIAYGVTQVLYREYDGVSFGPAASLHQSPPGSIQLMWVAQYPLITFTEPSGDNQVRIRVTDRSTGEFLPARLLDTRNDIFAHVLAYNATSGTFVDLTAAAQNYSAGDMVHPSSNALLQYYGDALYLGMDLPFRVLHLLLSQPGAGGTVGFSYWNGTQWISFTPFSGDTALDQADTAIRFWTDYDSIPPDWQRVVVDGHSAFWIRLTALDAFSVSPVGSMAAALSNVTAVSTGRS
jgi:hypothetical protein